MPLRRLAALLFAALLLAVPSSALAIVSAPVPEPGAPGDGVSRGGIVTTGWGVYGQLGQSATSSEENFWQAGNATDWTQVSTGYASTCAIKTDGTLWCWGYNADARLGTGDRTQRTTPTRIGTAVGWRKVSVGNSYACAIAADGALWCWGNGNNGKLGTGNQSTAQSPVKIGTSAWVDVAAGQDATCAIATTGALWCFGYGAAGQLGNGSTSRTSVPLQVGTSVTWARVSLGASHACATQINGTLWCWGSGSNGKLGTGNTSSSTSPKQVGTANTWTQPSLGYDSSCATRTDGTLWCWGSGSNGQLGNGSTSNQSNPVQVASDVPWNAVASSRVSTCASKVDATFWCWGSNSNGQLGTGNGSGQKNTPFQLQTPATAAIISEGSTALHTALVTDDTAPVTACPNLPTTKAFASIGDTDPYGAIPGGTFEGSDPWTLTNASIIPGNDGLTITTGASSLRLGTTRGQASTATSAPFCVNAGYPTLRFTLKAAGNSGKITVVLRYRSRADGATVSEITSTTINLAQAGTWIASPKIPLATKLSSSQLRRGATIELSLRADAAAATAGGVQIDSVLADPR